MRAPSVEKTSGVIRSLSEPAHGWRGLYLRGREYPAVAYCAEQGLRVLKPPFRGELREAR